MSTRIVIGLDQGADAAAVRRALGEDRAARSAAPVDSLPDVILAEVDDADAEAFIARAKATPGVRYAERDAPRFTS